MHANKWTACLLVLWIPFVAGCATPSPRAAGAGDSDPGYFLSMKQKGQLIGQGRIEDSAGIWYDVWIVPGYVQPARRTKTYVRKAGSNFAEYGKAGKYRSLARRSKRACKWAFSDCLVDFTIEGVPELWRNSFSSARERTERRVFGWWFAYPWALMEGLVGTVVVVPLGAAGTVGGTAWGAAVVPAYHMVDSAAAGTWHLAVDAILFPAVACTWNTVVAPPLAMVGQKPSPSRVDGFWVTQVTAGEIAREAMNASPPDSKELQSIAQWGRQLLAETQTFEDRRRALTKETQDQISALRKKEQEAASALAAEEKARVVALGGEPGAAYEARRARVQSWMPELRGILTDAGDLTPQQVNRIMTLLTQYPPSARPPEPVIRSKTDPVQRSLEIITDQ